MPDLASQGEYINQSEAARRFGLAHATLRKRARDGRLTVFIHPLSDRQRFFRVSDLEALRDSPPLPRQRDRMSVA